MFYVQKLFFRKSYRSGDNVKKCGKARGISKATGTHAHEHAHAPGYPHARTHTQRQIYNAYYLSTEITIRERSSMLRYTYTACLVPKVM